MDYEFLILAVLWLGGGNYIIYLSLRRQHISLLNLINPFVIRYLERKDWLRLLLLVALTTGTAIVVHSLRQ